MSISATRIRVVFAYLQRFLLLFYMPQQLRLREFITGRLDLQLL